MKSACIAIFAAGALLLAIHLIKKLILGYGSTDANDAIAIMVMAAIARHLFTDTKTG